MLHWVPGSGLSARMGLSSARLTLDWPVRGLKGALSGMIRVDGQSYAGRIPVELYMTKFRCIAALGLCLLASCVAMAARTPHSADGNSVSGTYAIEKSTDADADTQVTLQVQLTNSGDAQLQSVDVALRSVLSGTTQEIPASFSIPAQGNADFTATVTISQAELKLWQGGARPVLILKLQSSDGSQFTVSVALLHAVREAQ